MKNLLVAATLALAVLVLCLPGLGARDFWPPDEARYGEVARELIDGAPPALPHLNGEIYPDKPPGWFWAVRAAHAALGEPRIETSARLPSVAGALALVLLCGLWLARTGGPVQGLVGGLALLGTYRFVWQTRRAQLDMLYAALIGLMMAAFFRAWSTGRRGWCVAGFLLLFLAVFVKGPLALLGVVTVVAWAVATRRPRTFFNLGSLAGLLLLLALAGGWLLWAYRAAEALAPGGGERWLQEAVLKQTVERAGSGLAHEKPGYAYLYLFPLNTLPFFPLLLLLLARPVRDALAPADRPVVRFAALWLVAFLVPMSLFPGKRELYLLPLMLPFVLVLVPALAAAARAAPRPVLGWCGFVAGVLLLTGAAAAAGGFSEESMEALLRAWADLSGRPFEEVDPAARGLDPAGLRRHLLVLAAAVLPVALAALVAATLRAPRAAVAWCALACATTSSAACAVVLPDLDPAVSRRGVAEMVHAHRAAEDGAGAGPTGVLRHTDEGLLFYHGPPVPEVASRERDPAAARAAVARFLERPGALVVGRRRDARRLGLQEGVDFRVLDERRAGSKTFLLMGRPR